ncbi:MAG: hypothetical protein OXH00_18460 [Candidatus Poribacteria bacterium]|nr:hypothetical protein [Candidatus Poribacteria bacterium]
MRQEMIKLGAIDNRDTSSHSGKIGDINISLQSDSDQVILILENCGDNQERIFIHCRKASNSGTVLMECVQLFSGETHTLKLPEGFMKWIEFYCRLDGRKQSSTSDLDLKELLNETEKEVITKSPQVEIKSPVAKQETEYHPKITIPKETEPEKETDNTQIQISTDIRQETETTYLDKTEHEIGLEEVTQDDKLIEFVENENITLTEEEPIIVNQIEHTIRDWITELEQSYAANRDLVQTLRYSEQAFKEKLKTITECEQENSEEYDQFISQFIKDRLFNGVARFTASDQLPEQLEQCLQLVGYEVVPIEIGKTQADARVHDIQGSRQTNGECGTVVEVILPGLRRVADGEIIQKPVVIRGE